MTSSECRGCTASTHPSTEGAVLLFPGRSCKLGGTSWWSWKGPWTTASGSRWVSSRTPSPRSHGWTKGSSATNHLTSQDAVLCFSSTLRPAFPSVPRAAGQSLTQPYLHFREPLNSFHFKTVPLCGSKGYLLTVYHNLQAAVWFIPLWHTDKLDWQDIYLHYLLTLWQCECTIS